MTITKNKRKEMGTLIYNVFDALDPSEITTNRYRQMFKKMSDVQFDTFFKQFFSNDMMYLTLDIVDYERDLTIENVEKAAKILDVPLFEKVVTPFVNGNTQNPVITKFEVPVGYVHCKRVQQMLSKKNSTSTDIGQRSALTGQVVGKDKNGRESDTENFALLSINAHHILREFNGPRADDMTMKSDMYSQISQTGFVSLDTLNNSVENKTTLNTLDVYMIGMGIKSDLITDGLHVKKTLK